jgi:hypothetical protein
MRSGRCSISGVRGIGLRPRHPRDPDPTLFAPKYGLKLNRSLSLPSVPLPSGTNGAYVFLSPVVVLPTIGGTLRALEGIANVGAPFGIGRESWVCGAKTARGRCQNVVGACNSWDPSPVKLL